MQKLNISKKTVKSHLFTSKPLLFLALFFLAHNHSLAQDENLGAPLPGASSYNVNMSIPTAPAAGSVQQPSAAPIAIEADKEKSIFLVGMSSDKYPVSINGLKNLADKFKEDAIQGSFDSDNLDSISAWLDGLIRAHNRLANAFFKQSDLRANYDNECSLIRQLRGIRNQILYIRAQELIKKKKLKQAIPMLIDITCSEPNSALGLKAYQHLKQSGFSSEGSIALSKPAEDSKSDKDQ